MSATRSDEQEKLREEALVWAAQEGDREAMEQLFHRFRDAIYQYIFHMTRDEEEAADLTQDTFIRVFHSLNKLRQAGAFRVWLYRIAVNLVRDERRRSTPSTLSLESMSQQDGGEGEEDSTPVEIPDWSDNPETVTLRDEGQRAVRTAINELSEDHREVVVMHHLEGLELRDMAKLLEIPVGTVKSRLARARAHLHRLLADWVEGGTT